MKARRIGILGGTFDPIHCGHLDAARAAESALDLTEIVVIPVNIPPHRPQPVASSYHRFAMIAIAIAGRERWRASDLELGLGSPSFTTGTLQRLRDRGLAATELYFIIGADAFAEIESWKDFPAILDRAHFAVISRPGFLVGTLPARLPALAHRMANVPGAEARATPSIFLIDAPTADVSSTAIRRGLVEGSSVAGLVPPGVRQYIEQHALYSASPPGDFGIDADRAPTAGRLHGQD
jgi:nicotinate-nucleotide adenylyltransferase